MMDNVVKQLLAILFISLSVKEVETGALIHCLPLSFFSLLSSQPF